MFLKAMNIIKKHKYYVLSFLATVMMLVWLPIFSQSYNHGLAMFFFDVGQGDAEFLDFFDGNQILIDGGPDGSILQKLGAAMQFYDKSIDIVVLTHPHKDHIFGLIEVLKRYEVGKIILPRIDFDSPFYDEFLDEAESRNIAMEYLGRGDVISIGDFAVLDFLSPESKNGDERDFGFGDDAESFGLNGEQLNNKSLVFKLIFGNNSVLFTGDAGVEIENEIISSRYDLRSDILKVGHHGSRYSSSEDFLKSVDPQYAIIEVGKDNRYGHPAERTTESISIIGAKILRTDLDGDVIFGSDGGLIFLKKPGIFTSN